MRVSWSPKLSGFDRSKTVTELRHLIGNTVNTFIKGNYIRAMSNSGVCSEVEAGCRRRQLFFYMLLQRLIK